MVDRAGVAAAIEWRGFELRPPPQPMIDPGSAEWRTRQAVAAGHGERGDVSDAPPIIPWTRKAHELSEFARERDCLHAVRRSLFRAHFVDHIDIGRIDLLLEIAGGAGLDRSEAKAVLDVDRYTATVLGHRESALEDGVRDVPVLVQPGERLEGPELLREIERAMEVVAATGEGNPATGRFHGTRESNREE
jgi:predicted DsbA family dithiol-disulfide isomerase